MSTSSSKDLQSDRETPTSSRCHFCSKIISFFDIPPGKVNLGKVSDILDSQCPHVEIIRAWLGRLDAYDPQDVGLCKLLAYSYDSHHILMALLRNTDNTGGNFPFDNETEELDTKLWRLVATNGQPKHKGTARVLDPHWIDLDTVQTWYSECSIRHSQKCENATWIEGNQGEEGFPEWLIDVSQGCVVPFSAGMKRYFTLSYTWGKVTNLKTTSRTLQRLLKPGALVNESSIPQTIHDAIQLTKALGENYIWVDSLCIIQDDEAALYRNLNRMHLIYANSALCIVAQAGTNASFGLRGIRGVSSARDLDQQIFDIADGNQLLLPTVYQPGENKKLGSGYEERAWTYQEYMFSKRRLVFNGGPLSWHCSCSVWSEELKLDLLSGEICRAEFTEGNNLRSMHIPDLDKLLPVISDFGTRYLTDEEDILLAFLGIQAFLHQVFPGGLNFGHPELFFDISLVWGPWGDNLIRRTASAKVDLLRDKLPSWSWMGWRGKVLLGGDSEYYCDTSQEHGYSEPVTQWFAMEGLSPLTTKRSIDNRWYEYKQLTWGEKPYQFQGWTREPFTSHAETIGSPHAKFKYAHDMKPDRQYWYPMPVQYPEHVPVLKEQMQYLYCMTSRVVLYPSDRRPDVLRYSGPDECVQLNDKNGHPAGILIPHNQDDRERFRTASQVDLVAVVKGWAKGSCYDSSGLPLPYKNEKKDCYFVLCVQWENGVAKRKASGLVLSTVWEMNQEPVELILG